MRILMAVLVATTACSSSGSADSSPDVGDDLGIATDTAGADVVEATDSTTAPDVLADASDAFDAEVYGPYPGAPYGNKVGDILPNLAWQGYVNATADAVSTTQPFVSTSLDALRRTARKPYALVHASDFI